METAAKNSVHLLNVQPAGAGGGARHSLGSVGDAFDNDTRR